MPSGYSGKLMNGAEARSLSNTIAKCWEAESALAPSPWSVVIVTAAVFSFYASARSLQIGDGVAVIAVTSVAANLSTILAGLAVFGDRLGNDPLVVGVRIAAFAMILIGAALIPAPVRAGEALDQSAAEPERATPNPA
jgi:hypothetical protein